MDLRGESVILMIEGINETKRIQTKVYDIPIRDKQGKAHLVTCYGLPEIAKAVSVPDKKEYEDLCKKFQVDPGDVRRPSHIDVLLSSKDNFLMSDKVEAEIDGVKLYSGPLGMAFMGDIQGEKEKVNQVQAFPVNTVVAAEDNSTESALHCKRRLQANKGKVQLIVSNAGTELKGAARELQYPQQ